MANNVVRALRLMLVTDDRLVPAGGLVETCRAAVRGGVTSVQLRLKQVEPRELVTLARELVAAVPVPVLVNDRLDVALAAGAAGVHLGPDDLPVALARRVAPPGFLIGASVGGSSELESGTGADYWGVGPWDTTTTKANAGDALGAEGFRRIVARAGGIPCIAIGGVRPEDVAGVLGAGGAGVAVVSGILGRPDVEAAAREYLRQQSTVNGQR
ncbi:MAG TPA: thiamine phosphate synthase [Gemmatimonadales bacterium]|nr:thiamine phosphate synthase [Gemmatimonadales bacterium]